MPHHRREPHWLPAHTLRRSQTSDALRHWLLDRGSLTRRLKQRCSDNFRVRLLGQGWAKPMHNEAVLLHQPHNQRAQVREVFLLCDGVPWVFARTIIPAHSLEGRERRLVLLGERPLGELLFADPTMERGPVQVARLQPGQRLHRLAMATSGGPGEVWGRRSLFYLDHHPLLVSEFFLPGMGL